MTRQLSEYLNEIGVEFYTDLDVARASSIGISSVASFFVMPKSVEQLINVLRLLVALGIKYRVVGAMSNLVPREPVFDGVIVTTRNITQKSAAENIITCDCGVMLNSVVRFGEQNSLGGIEALYHIPGTIGGAVHGNAGAFDIEISDAIKSAEIYLPRLDEIVTFAPDELEFSYRDSLLKRSEMVLLRLTLELKRKAPQAIRERISEITALRSNQPTGVRSAGSVFKRHNGVGAGYYIDKAGLKGLTVGGAAVSIKHAGFLVNLGNATPGDFVTLIGIVKEKVLEKFGILLEEEIEFL